MKYGPPVPAQLQWVSPMIKVLPEEMVGSWWRKELEAKEYRERLLTLTAVPVLLEGL
jgi:hypothetical protein